MGVPGVGTGTVVLRVAAAEATLLARFESGTKSRLSATTKTW